MSPHLIILFVAVPMAAGILSLALHGRRTMQGVIGAAALLINFAMACVAVGVTSVGETAGRVLVSQMGNWPAPFGISVVVDGLSACMLAASSLVALCVFLYSVTQLGTRHLDGFFHPLFHLLVFGVQWSFVTGDLFNLFVAFEIMLMASYALFIVGNGREQIRQASKYILINLVGSTFFVTLAGLLYGHTGTLNMADLARLSVEGQMPRDAIPVVALLLLVFGAKTAMFPFWYWLPETYPTLPAPVGALMGGLLTKVGAYVMLRVFILVFGAWGEAVETLRPVMFAAAVVGFVLGGVGALSVGTMRQVFALGILSQVAYMVLGVALGTVAAVAGTIFFIMHNMLVKSALFLTAGLVRRHAGSDRFGRVGGLLPAAPWLATLFFLAGVSLAGLPPTSGFFGKWMLLRETFSLSHPWLAAAALLASLLSLWAIVRVWVMVFWGERRGAHARHEDRRPPTCAGHWAVGVLVAASILMGLFARPLLDVTTSAARTLVDRQGYIDAVMGGRQP